MIENVNRYFCSIVTDLLNFLIRQFVRKVGGRHAQPHIHQELRRKDVPSSFMALSSFYVYVANS